MSKALKAIATKHRPHIAARMTAENGYDGVKHLHVADLHKAGIISKLEADDLGGCVDDLAGSGDPLAAFLKAAETGEVKSDGLNNQDLVDALTTDSDEDADDGDGMDDMADSDSKVTA